MLRTAISLIAIGFIVIPCTSVYAQGLQGEYFNNMTLSGDPVLTRVEPVYFDWGGDGPGDPLGADLFSVRWVGSITAPVSGEYVFSTNTDDGVRVWLGPELIINNWTDHGATVNTSQPVSLKEGTPVGIRVEFYENGGSALMELSWTGPGIPLQAIPAEVLSPTEVRAVKAWKPKPADGTIGVVSPLLEWTAGETATWHDVYLGTDPNLTEADLVAPRHFPTLYYHAMGLEPGSQYYWRIDEIEKDAVTIHGGDVWTFVMEDVVAYYPDPEDGATDGSIAPDLTWKGITGATGHHVYFSEDMDAVAQGTAAADQGLRPLDEPNFAPGELEPLSTYYWRVDEVLTGDQVVTGDVWTFTTHLPLDDFESYTQDIDAGEAVFQTWIDGWENSTGSLVGYEQSANGTFNETTIVHGGGQAMPLDYNNVGSPWYSEASREFATARNWTADDLDALVLHVRGTSGSAPASLYVALEDASGNVAVVTYPEPAITGSLRWTEWRIPLSGFAGVNLARVQTMYLGLGDRSAPAPGGAGLVFIDDIYLVQPSSVAE